MIFKDKKVLLVGLGILGGGESIADFLYRQGARLTVTDLKKKKELKNSLKKLKSWNIKFVLGRHRKKDFKDNEMIVFNQSVSVFSPWVKLAKKLKKKVENDLTIFLNLFEKKKPQAEYIAITGTRGKTTTAAWTSHFLRGSVLGGNIPTKGLLKIISKKTELFVLEIPSYQLEFMRKGLKPPKIAVITNLYNDHLNRHGTFKNYLNEKAKIFLNQKKEDFLVLNYDDKYAGDFLKKNPKSQIYYFSLKKLPADRNGLFFNEDRIYFQENAHLFTVVGKCAISGVNFAEHQKTNLLAALLAAYLYERNWDKLVRKIKTLPAIPFRQEIVFKNKSLTIINDTSATSPDATIVAIERFKSAGNNLILITGGTDKNLDFKDLAREIKKYIKRNNLFMLSGSATIKTIKELEKLNYFKKEKPQVFESLRDILFAVKKRSNGIILFSPASASFEKFKNEFDRGKQFNKLIKKFASFA